MSGKLIFDNIHGYIELPEILGRIQPTKIVRDNTVWGFIVKNDFKHFRKGDILKAAGFNAPALNQARGNILDDDYSIAWTGPHYLK